MEEKEIYDAEQVLNEEENNTEPNKKLLSTGLVVSMMVTGIMSHGNPVDLPKKEEEFQQCEANNENEDNGIISNDLNKLIENRQSENELKHLKQEKLLKSGKNKKLVKVVKKIPTFKEKIESIGEKSKKELPKIKQRANTKLANGETHINYSVTYFKKTKGVENKKGVLKMPTDLKNELAPVIPGLISQESKFRKDVVSSAGAIGSTQVMPENIVGSKSDFINSFPLQLRECFRNFERIWNIFKKGTTYEKNGKKVKVERMNFITFKNKYGLSDTEFNKFLILCMINAYNTGETRMLKIINKFQKEIPEYVANQRKDKSAEGLFTLMTEIAYRFKWNKGYGKDSFHYTMNSVAYANELGILDKENSDFRNTLQNANYIQSNDNPFELSENNKLDLSKVVSTTTEEIDYIITKGNQDI
ncbi:MAG: lytic transglycosylase domain-containing protein [Candidatus Gracilibacteria bacterium]|nr:lytic transglycosylase domain-containing protein [Candidatus Gracilibacteria bacterium]